MYLYALKFFYRVYLNQTDELCWGARSQMLHLYLYAFKTETNTSLLCDKYVSQFWEKKQHIMWFCRA